MQGSEELVVNVAAAISNLSFYQTEDSALGRSRLTVGKRKSSKLSVIYLCLSFSFSPPHAAPPASFSDDEAAAQLQHGRRAGGRPRAWELDPV